MNQPQKRRLLTRRELRDWVVGGMLGNAAFDAAAYGFDLTRDAIEDVALEFIPPRLGPTFPIPVLTSRGFHAVEFQLLYTKGGYCLRAARVAQRLDSTAECERIGWELMRLARALRKEARLEIDVDLSALDLSQLDVI